MTETKRILHLTTAGYRPQQVEIAPESNSSPSKRLGLIKEEDKALDHNLIELDVGTKARNKAFQDRLDEVWSSTAGWEAKLRTEAIEAVETITHMKEDYEKQFIKFDEALQDELKSLFDKFDNEDVPKAIARIDFIEKDLDVFVQVTAPKTMDDLVGKVSRQLKKAYETFDIEQQKEQKRETKLVSKSNHHLQNTAQRFHDEDALMDSCFFNLEDEVVEHERRAVRMHLRRLNVASNDIREINEVLLHENTTREAEDLDVLDTVIETQGLLQKNIITTFGQEQEPILDTAKFNKLNKRMSKKSSSMKSSKSNKEFR